MFKHILVPTDLTPRSLKALEIAMKIAGVSPDARSTVTLFHVIETIEDATCEEFEAFYKALGKKAEKKMVKIIAEHHDEGILLEKVLAYGKRVQEIIRYSDEKEVDLIVLSSHRIDPENAAEGWGTISYKVGILSHCPVMLVK